MSGISIEIPSIDAEQSIEIEVRVNGQKKQYHYRVEIFAWDQCEENEPKAVCLKKKIQSYNKNWKLVHIGGDSEKKIPLMFKEMN